MQKTAQDLHHRSVCENAPTTINRKKLSKNRAIRSGPHLNHQNQLRLYHIHPIVQRRRAARIKTKPTVTHACTHELNPHDRDCSFLQANNDGEEQIAEGTHIPGQRRRQGRAFCWRCRAIGGGCCGRGRRRRRRRVEAAAASGHPEGDDHRAAPRPPTAAAPTAAAWRRGRVLRVGWLVGVLV